MRLLGAFYFVDRGLIYKFIVSYKNKKVNPKGADFFVNLALFLCVF
jgi:hypothetical protein